MQHHNPEFPLILRESCPVCANAAVPDTCHCFDDRYGQPDLFDIVKCSNPHCSLAFLKQTISPEYIGKLYEKYYHHSFSPRRKSPAATVALHLLRRVRNIALNAHSFYSELERGQSVLDVGCGYGPDPFMVRRMNLEWSGLEVDSKKAEHIRNNRLEAHCLTLEAFAASTSKTFDRIILNQVIEHIVDPVSLMSALFRLLSPDGKLLLATPNYASKYRRRHQRLWIHHHVPYHVSYFDETSLAYLCGRFRLRIERIYSRTPFEYFVLQSNVQPCARGQPNPTFSRVPSLKHLTFFVDLGNYCSHRRRDEDCLYAVIARL